MNNSFAHCRRRRPVPIHVTVLSRLLLSLCILASSFLYGATSSNFHHGREHRVSNRDPYLQAHAQNLTELAAFVSAGMGVVVVSVFNRGFSEMAAVRPRSLA